MEASIHTIHCHTAIGGKIVCRLRSAFVNKQKYYILAQFFWLKNHTKFFLIILY